MGGCASKQSSKKQGKPIAKIPEVPVFRRESVIYHDLPFDNACPWRKQTTYEDPSGVIPDVIKETVLQDKWFEILKDPADDSKCSVDCLYLIDSPEIEDDHYDFINEREIEPPFSNKKNANVSDSPVCKKKKQKRKKRKIDRKLPALPKPPVGEKDIKLLVPSERKHETEQLLISKEEERSQCLEYSEMVTIFKPLIVNTLNVEDILPSLAFLDNHDDIYTDIRNGSRKNHVVSLLDELERSEELGKWQKFLDALSANGYTYIVDNIRGYKFISPEYQKEYIRKLKPKIGKMIKTCELLPYLQAKGLLGSTDSEVIQRKFAKHGNFAAAAELLNVIHEKERNWYILLIEALQEANMNDVAVCLNIPHLCKKISDTTGTCSVPPKLDSNNDENNAFFYGQENHIEINNIPNKLSKEDKQSVKNIRSQERGNSSLAGASHNITLKEEESQCLEYREMMLIFKPLIVQNLLVEDILPSLPFLENHDDIYASMRNHSPKSAVLSLLDEMELSKELGKWEKFMDALLENGYTYIVDNIRGYKFISHQYQKEYIKKITPKLSKMIDTREILPYLLASGVISDSDNQNIQQDYANRGSIAAAIRLLDRITRKNGNWYVLFIEALQEANMEDVAVCLQIPELLETNRTKPTAVGQTADDTFYDDCTEKVVSEYNKIEETETYSKSVVGESQGGNSARRKFSKGQNVADTYNDDTEVHLTERDVSEYVNPDLRKAYRKNTIGKSQGGNSSYRHFPKDQDHSDVVYHIPPVPNDTDLDMSPMTVKQKRKVPLPIWTNDDLQQFIDDVLESENTKVSKGALTSKLIVESLRSKGLQDECEQMQNELEDLHIQIERLEQKALINEKLNTALKQVRELEQKNELKEKERQALKSEDFTTEHDADDEANNTDVYYQTVAKPNQHVCTDTATTTRDVWTKQTYDFCEPFLLDARNFSKLPKFNLDSTRSVVQVFSPSFDSRSTIYQMFEKDSGIGTDMALEFD